VNTTVLVLAVMLLIAGAGLGVMVAHRRKSERLQRRFGPEYERRVAETGDRKAAETDLHERERRRNQLDVRGLRPEERARFQESWTATQSRFVDAPATALKDADLLVVEIMRVRGYPVEDFDRRAEDISVDHPDVVRHYRDARAIYDASTDGSVDTERQRHALTCYRSLVQALLSHDDTVSHDDTRPPRTPPPHTRPGTPEHTNN
jgi:hypothetical protein